MHATTVIFVKFCIGQQREQFASLFEWSFSCKQSTERNREQTYAGGQRDQCQPEGIVGHFLCFVPSSYVTQKCSDRQKDGPVTHASRQTERWKMSNKEEERQAEREGEAQDSEK